MEQTITRASCDPVCRTQRRERRNTYTPRVDIQETDEALTLYADLPGVCPDDLELRFENGELMVHGRVAPRVIEGVVRCEFDTGDYWRVFRLTQDIDVNRITATLQNGVMTLRLPKSRRFEARRIAVSE